MVIPIHDRNPTRRFAVVTYALIALNILVFLTEPVARTALPGGQSVAKACAETSYFDKYAAIPKEVTTNKPLPPHQYVIDTGNQRVACPVTNEKHKQPWLSVLFAMFLHGGWLHLLGNMLFLYVFGNNVEDRMGRLLFLAFYLGCGYAAAYGFSFANAGSTTTLVGASGAIAGVLGAYLVLYPRAKVTSLVPFLFFIPFRLPAWLVLGFWFVLQYFYSAGAAVSQGAGVAYLAHVIGFIVGAIVALPFRRSRPPAVPPHQAWRYGY